MARIVYGVAGEGFGHSSRSEMIGKYLLEQGHDVIFYGSKQSFHYLDRCFPGRVRPIFGPHLNYQNGRVHMLSTVLSNLISWIRSKNTASTLAEVKNLKPDLVISDFQPILAQWAVNHKVPCLVIDHQTVITNLKLDRIPGTAFSKWVAATIVRHFYRGIKHFVTLNFFREDIRTKDCVLLPPILRRQVGQIRPRQGDHVLCYVADKKLSAKLIRIFEQIPEIEFIIYGPNEQSRQGNCRYKRTSTEDFLNDLAGCRMVIATAGFSLISECLHYQKKMLLIPIKGQYEQLLNSYYVEKLGLGKLWSRYDRETLFRFIYADAEKPCQEEKVLRPDNRLVFCSLNQKINEMLASETEKKVAQGRSARPSLPLRRADAQVNL